MFAYPKQAIAFFVAFALLISAKAEPLHFNRDIRPILSDNCFRCHGPDKNNRKKGLRLDVREDALAKKAFVPGKADEGKLIERIFSKDPEEMMPPPESNKHLTDEQKNTLKRWIAEGAQYEPHWAYIKPVKAPVPQVKDKKWVTNPIDAFVLQQIEAKNWKPSPEADKGTLLRRLSLDLTGLPPTLAELNAFLKDHSSRAYEKQVDRLLASPHFGERMAVPWLDNARFTDTVGYHGDQNQRIFPYRDYVINSFNKNKPFDQFAIEQLAGDLLPHPTDEQLVATGFNRLNMMTREGGAQPKEYLAKYGADRVRTVSGAFLGSTMGCCECHDHKYDPFTTRDFYSMKAFFADIQQWGVYADYGYTPNPELKGVGNEHPFYPEIEVASPYLQARMADFNKRIDSAIAASSKKMTKEQKKDFDAWRTASLSFIKANTNGWLTPKPTAKYVKKEMNTEPNTNFVVEANGNIQFVGKPGETEVSLPLTNGIWMSAIRVELVPDKKLTVPTKKKRPTDASISFTAELENGTNKTAIDFYHAEADHKKDRFSNGASIIGVKDMWNPDPNLNNELQTAVWVLNKPVHVATNETLKLRFKENGVAALRISISPFAATKPLESGATETLAKALKKNDRTKLQTTYFLSTAWDTNALADVRKNQRQVLECRNGRAYTMVTKHVNPMVTHILPRGNWQDDSAPIVQPATPAFLHGPQAEGTNILSRLDLAKWVVSRENPLTSRAIVNRLWKHMFGNGISANCDDLGAQGEPPSHPELLDWLAVEFEDSGWNVKHMVKLMVMSSTYREASNQPEQYREEDPNNRLLTAQLPRRLDAEFVRDNALEISGLINLDVGGPSVFPYQPAGYYANIQFPERDYYPNKDDRQYRRGVYMHWQRTFLHPMLANFDAPAREESVCTRNVSNSPQQALTLLNDPTFVEASRVFAEDVLEQKSKSDDKRLEYAFEKALARPVKQKEKASLLKFLNEQRQHTQEHKDEPEKLIHVGIAPVPSTVDKNELTAWTEVCRVILNLHETITRY
jgi:hypothetical protein